MIDRTVLPLLGTETLRTIVRDIRANIGYWSAASIGREHSLRAIAELNLELSKRKEVHS